jgi:hypothetical protein
MVGGQPQIWFVFWTLPFCFNVWRQDDGRQTVLEFRDEQVQLAREWIAAGGKAEPAW